jgi:hydroxyacylglutathione hydrolase
MLTVKQFNFSPVQENTYVVYNENDACCIIDPGCYSVKERNELKEFISDLELQPKYLLNTHCHLDHIFGNKFIHETYDLTLHIHEKEKPVLARGPEMGQMWGMPFENYSGDLIFLSEYGQVKLDDDKFTVLFTPGHSPGSICFYCEAQQFVISGDVLFERSIGRTDLPGGDYDTLINSIRSKLFILPDNVKVYPGHGYPTTIGDEKLNNPFLN